MRGDERPKDGMFSRFTGPVMSQICGLAPDFNFRNPEPEANVMYTRMRRLARFQKLAEAQREVVADRVLADSTANWSDYQPLVDRLPERVTCSGRAYRCTAQPSLAEIDLVDGRQNPMELLHILAHYLQPPGGPWHGGEFGSLFLTLIERQFGADMKRAVKDIMVANKIKTSVRSPATREKQAARFFEKKVEKAPAGLAKILQEMRDLQNGI